MENRMNIKVLDDFKSLKKDDEWNDIPKFAVLTGKNGTGKSQLLDICGNTKFLSFPFKRDEINYIRWNWNFHKDQPSQNIPEEKMNIENNMNIFYDIYNVFFELDKINKESKKLNTNLKEILINRQFQEFQNLLNTIPNQPFNKINILLFEYNLFDFFILYINLADKLQKNWLDLTEDDLLNNDISSLLDTNLSDEINIKKFLYNYQISKKKRLLKCAESKRFDKVKKIDKIEMINNEQNPINIMNKLFDKYRKEYNFKYSIKDLVDSDYNNGVNQIPLKFINKDNNIEINFTELSSGEQMIVSLIMWLHNENTGLKVKCLLLDEIDAHLHPSLSKMMIEILTEIAVKEYGIQVIMTTHKASTIAYTPEESIFVVNESGIIPRVDKQSKSKAIEILSDGLFVISEENINATLSYSINRTNKPILLVEGITDKIILETAWEKLELEEMPFFIQDFFSCGSITNLLQHSDFQLKYQNRIFIGLFDNDDAGYNQYNSFKKEENNNFKIINLKNDKNKNDIFITLLSPPDDKKFLIENEQDTKNFEIEDYFNNKFPNEKTTEITLTIKNDDRKRKYQKLNDKAKSEFANSVKDFPKEDFDNFKILFDKINIILKGENNVN
ncbi:MAG: hypothetical protein Ta2D_09190 [Rickettsiales bacterium]|nr:MAG: hypothetical protein Ta2D_09190 [Rickettsiales bacterium]